MLFIVDGKYDVGYEVNKKPRKRAQFGPSTIIGLFEMAFQKRHLFTMYANTNVAAYSLRKKNF